MKKFKVKYQCGQNILITTVTAPNELSARYEFYRVYGGTMDILSIAEVVEEE